MKGWLELLLPAALGGNENRDSFFFFHSLELASSLSTLSTRQESTVQGGGPWACLACSAPLVALHRCPSSD